MTTPHRGHPTTLDGRTPRGRNPRDRAPVSHHRYGRSNVRNAAIRQAQDRADRTGVLCFVYLQPHRALPVWYVRTEAEGRPDGATLEYTATPVWAATPANEEAP